MGCPAPVVQRSAGFCVPQDRISFRGWCFNSAHKGGVDFRAEKSGSGTSCDHRCRTHPAGGRKEKKSNLVIRSEYLLIAAPVFRFQSAAAAVAVVVGVTHIRADGYFIFIELGADWLRRGAPFWIFRLAASQSSAPGRVIGSLASKSRHQYRWGKCIRTSLLELGVDGFIHGEVGMLM